MPQSCPVFIRKRRKLFEWQQSALDYANSRSRIALFMEMRLGKTTVVIRWLSRITGRKLVIMPGEAVLGWLDELHAEYIPTDRVVQLIGSRSERMDRLMQSPDNCWCLINYEGLRVLRDDIIKISWDAVVLDESTRIRKLQSRKKSKTKWEGITSFCLHTFNDVPNRAIMTGYPAPEGPLDYWCQLAFLYGKAFGCNNYWVFRHKFFRTDHRGWEWEPKPGTRDTIKQIVHDTAFVLTRKQVQGFGIKMYSKRVVQPTSEQKKLHRQADKDFAVGDMETKWAVTKITWMARIAGGFHPETKDCISDNKYKELISLFKGELKKEPIVVWFRFNNELDYVYRRLLKDKDARPAFINGSVSKPDRTKIVKAFQRRITNILCMQIKCGRFGLDLSVASTSIYYSNRYDGEDRAQTEDRIIHASKSDPLLLIDLITTETIDEDIVDLVREKRVSGRRFMAAVIDRATQRSRRLFPGDYERLNA